MFLDFLAEYKTNSNHWKELMDSSLIVIISGILLAIGCTKCSSSCTNKWTSLKYVCHSKTYVQSKESSPET